MMTQVKVKVLRSQHGDKPYAKGDTRMLDKDDADRLAATGAVEIIAATPARKAPARKPAAKRAAAPKNKKAAAPANKAVTTIKNKSAR